MSGRVVYFESHRGEPGEALARQPAGPPPESPFRRYDGGPPRALSDRQIAHRRRMLDHLQRQSSAAS